MAEFSQKQLEQLNEIFGTPLDKLSQGVDELSRQISAINQRQIRQEVGLCMPSDMHNVGTNDAKVGKRNLEST